MHHLNVKKGESGTIWAQRKDRKPLTEIDKIEAKYLAALDEPLEVGSETGPLPYLEPDGNLVIPISSPPRYHWWRGGQSISMTIAELKANKARENNRDAMTQTAEPVQKRSAEKGPKNKVILWKNTSILNV